MKVFAVALLAGLQVSSGFVVAPTNNGMKRPLPSTPTLAAAPLFAAATTSAQTKKAQEDSTKNIMKLWQDASVIFSVIDVDGNGSITREELSDHLSVSGYGPDVIDKIFAKLDKNKDEEISEQEFRSGFALLPGLQSAPGLGNYNAQFTREIHEDADQVFSSADEDGNGFVDEAELKNHLGRLHGQYSEDAAQKIFRMLDANGDRKISRDELRDAFVRYSALRQAIGEGPNYK